jgi:hypothetical protein
MSNGLLSSYTDGAVMSTALKPHIPNLQTLHLALSNLTSGLHYIPKPHICQVSNLTNLI